MTFNYKYMGYTYSIRVQKDDDSFIAFDDQFGLYSTGDTVNQAMENIKSNIGEYVNTLLETEDSELGVNFIRNKKILEEYKENINGD